MRCPWCGNRNDPAAELCAHCGKDILGAQSTEEAIHRLQTLDLPTPEIVCPQCGAYHTALAEYCSLCGHSFAQQRDKRTITLREALQSRDDAMLEAVLKRLKPDLNVPFSGSDPYRAPRRAMWSVMVGFTLFLLLCTLVQMVSVRQATNRADASQESVALPVPLDAELVYATDSSAKWETRASAQAMVIQYDVGFYTNRLVRDGWSIQNEHVARDSYWLVLERGDEWIDVVVRPNEEWGSYIDVGYYFEEAEATGPGMADDS